MDTENFVAAIGGFIIILFLTWILITDLETFEDSNCNRQNEQSAREKQYGLDKRRYRVEFLTLVVVLIYAGLAY
jgi:hypothetical protein